MGDGPLRRSIALLGLAALGLYIVSLALERRHVPRRPAPRAQDAPHATLAATRDILIPSPVVPTESFKQVTALPSPPVGAAGEPAPVADVRLSPIPTRYVQWRERRRAGHDRPVTMQPVRR